MREALWVLLVGLMIGEGDVQNKATAKVNMAGCNQNLGVKMADWYCTIQEQFNGARFQS